MLYLLLCSAVMAIVLIIVATEMFRMIDWLEKRESAKPRHFRVLAAGLMGGLFIAPLLGAFLDAFDAESGQALSMSGGRTSVYLLAAGSVLCAGYAAFTWLVASREKTMGFWSIGQVVILTLAALVGGMSSMKHLTFFHTSQDGWANVELLKSISQINDMPECESPIALVQFRTEPGPIAYRCPRNLLFNRHTSQPFSPWPDYVEGTSSDLAIAIGAASSSAGQTPQ